MKGRGAMKSSDYIKWSFSYRRHLKACQSDGCLFCGTARPNIEELADIKTAVSEAVTNCIVHAYPGEIGDIWSRAKIVDEGTIEIMVRDNGVGIPDVNKAREPMFSTGGDDRHGLYYYGKLYGQG